MSKNNNTKLAFWVALSSMFSMCFGIISSMILSRYLDKVEYGTYKQVLYVYNSLLIVFTLGLPKAYTYFLPRSPQNEVRSLINKITRLFFFLGGLLSISLYLFSDFIASLLNNPSLALSLKIFSPVPFLMMPTMGLEGILATYKKTMFLSFYTFISRLVMLCTVTLPVIIFNFKCNDALYGFVIGSIIAFFLALYLKFYPVRNYGHIKTKFSYNEIFRFSLPLFVASIWGVLINSTDQFFISRYYGQEVFADFSNGAMELPFVGMIVGACSVVLTPLFTKKIYDNENIKTSICPVWLNTFEKSAMLIYPIVIFCIYDASLIMRVMYGDAYIESGSFFRIKLLTYFVKIISFYSLLMAIGATKYYAKIFMYNFFALVITEYMIVLIFNNPLLIAAIHSLFSIIICFIFLNYIANRFQLKIKDLFPTYVLNKVIIASIFSLFFVYIIQKVISVNTNSLIMFIIDSLVFFTAYLVISYLLNLNYLKILKPLIKK